MERGYPFNEINISGAANLLPSYKPDRQFDSPAECLGLTADSDEKMDSLWKLNPRQPLRPYPCRKLASLIAENVAPGSHKQSPGQTLKRLITQVADIDIAPDIAFKMPDIRTIENLHQIRIQTIARPIGSPRGRTVRISLRHRIETHHTCEPPATLVAGKCGSQREISTRAVAPDKHTAGISTDFRGIPESKAHGLAAILKPGRIGRLRRKSIVDRKHPRLAARRHLLTETCTTVDASYRPAPAMKIYQQRKRPADTLRPI